jgi:homoaconitate hydratase
MIVDAEKDMGESTLESTQATAENGEETLTEILPGFPEKVEGEILFL